MHYATEPFSTERYCPKCEETKHWTKFHKSVGLCADCYRASLGREVVYDPNGQKSKQHKNRKQGMTWEEMLAFLEKKTT